MSAVIEAPLSREMERRRRLQATAADPLLTRPEVEAETGLSRSTIYRKMDDGTFPRPRRVGTQCVRWPASEITAWKDEQPLSVAQN